MTPYFAIFAISLVVSLSLVPVVRMICIRTGHVDAPRPDRWHQQPTPNLGGIAIFASFILVMLLLKVWVDGWNDFPETLDLKILIGPAIMFILGLYDDFKEISPTAKIIGQIFAASVVIYQGYTTDFFNPRIENPLIAQIPNIILTFLWIIGITNAINLMDNMDGLAGGISIITALFLSYFFITAENSGLAAISVGLVGSLLGFLIFNFPPARIFMGDSGSMFLGFTLALLAIARQPQASNVFAVMGIPTFLFLIPIMDTILVTTTRIIRGKSPIKGGKDHTSHRLISLGFSERKTLFILFSMAIFSGLVAAFLESIRYWYSLVLVPGIVLILVLLISFIGGVKISEESTRAEGEGKFRQMVLTLTNRGKLFEVFLDFFIIGIAYYLAFLFRYNLQMNDNRLAVYLSTLPVVMGCGFLSFYAMGVYRGLWRYINMEEIYQYFKAVILAVFLSALVLYILQTEKTFNGLFFFFFGLFLFIGLVGSRSSFKIFRFLLTDQNVGKYEKVLIVGADDAGEVTLRFLQHQPGQRYKVVGFFDENPMLKGREIHSHQVFTDLGQLTRYLQKTTIDGFVFSPGFNPDSQTGKQLELLCEGKNYWKKRMIVEMQDIRTIQD
jgi:UDP-GlcNAc:undecaprenyl-phosphate GlcNAc-1-phosphate transferase